MVYKKEYREGNKDKILEHKKEYYEDNKDKILEHRKEYYKDNKDQINERCKKWYEQNKDKISEKKKQRIDCECGSNIRKSDLPKHKRTKKHIQYIECKSS